MIFTLFSRGGSGMETTNYKKILDGLLRSLHLSVKLIIG